MSPHLATFGRIALAGVIAAVPTAIVVMVFTAAWGDGKAASLIQLVVGAAVLACAYLGAAIALRIREVNQVTTMVRSRLGR